jgi:hypothetical protein
MCLRFGGEMHVLYPASIVIFVAAFGGFEIFLEVMHFFF